MSCESAGGSCEFREEELSFETTKRTLREAILSASFSASESRKKLSMRYRSHSQHLICWCKKRSQSSFSHSESPLTHVRFDGQICLARAIGAPAAGFTQRTKAASFMVHAPWANPKCLTTSNSATLSFAVSVGSDRLLPRK